MITFEQELLIKKLNTNNSPSNIFPSTVLFLEAMDFQQLRSYHNKIENWDWEEIYF